MEGENVVAYDGYLPNPTRVINSLISWNCFSKFNIIAQNKETGRKNEIAVNNEILKNHDFLHNVCEIAFAHQCEIMSKFRAIFTRNEGNLCVIANYCMILVQKISIGNPNCNAWFYNFNIKFENMMILQHF